MGEMTPAPRSPRPAARSHALEPTPAALVIVRSEFLSAIGNRNAARVLSRIVQRDDPPTSNPSPTAGTGTGTGTSIASPADGRARVQKAIAANDLAGLIVIEKELRAEIAKDPINPPLAVREGLANARHWAMERIATIRDGFASALATQVAATGSNEDHTPEREATEVSMDQQCTPFLGVLAEGHPEYRYEHVDPAVQEKVFAAVRLAAAIRGLGQIGHRAAAEAESRTHAGLSTGSWCGAFAFTQAEMAGGLDPRLKGVMQGEAGIRSALQYAGGAANPWVWVFDQWVPLKTYHQTRSSTRTYETIATGPPSMGIKPGDLVLIDNSFGTDPDHITTATSFDGRFLRTVGGNQGTASSTDEKGVSASGPFDLQQNPTPNDVTLPKSEWPVVDGKPVKTADKKLTKHTRVHGVGRWSIVDYERRLYSDSVTIPPKPSAKDLQAASL